MSTPFPPLKYLLKKRMNRRIRNILREEIEKIEEDYPEHFDMELFKDLSSFKKRVHYAQENLPRISSGSGRIVYKIDEKKVLKLARNKKGVAQNETEVNYYNDPVIRDIFAHIYSYDDDFRWVEMELVKKMNPKDFERIVGFKFNDYSDFIQNQYLKAIKGHKSDMFHIDEEKKEILEENEFVGDIIDFIVNFQVPAADLGRTSSYGIVERNDEEKVVLIDYGLSNDVYECYYC